MRKLQTMTTKRLPLLAVAAAILLLLGVGGWEVGRD